MTKIAVTFEFLIRDVKSLDEVNRVMTEAAKSLGLPIVRTVGEMKYDVGTAEDNVCRCNRVDDGR